MTSIQEVLKKGNWRLVAVILIGILSISVAFGLGRLTMLETSDPVKIEYGDSMTANVAPSAINSTPEPVSPSNLPQNGSETVVASKSGKKYYYPWCGGANNISAVNKISFANAEAAKAAGYTPAANCKGLK